jgi:hypothetical protein
VNDLPRNKLNQGDENNYNENYNTEDIEGDSRK